LAPLRRLSLTTILAVGAAIAGWAFLAASAARACGLIFTARGRIPSPEGRGA
jgi:hypothetical protein